MIIFLRTPNNRLVSLTLGCFPRCWSAPATLGPPDFHFHAETCPFTSSIDEVLLLVVGRILHVKVVASNVEAARTAYESAAARAVVTLAIVVHPAIYAVVAVRVAANAVARLQASGVITVVVAVVIGSYSALWPVLAALRHGDGRARACRELKSELSRVAATSLADAAPPRVEPANLQA